MFSELLKAKLDNREAFVKLIDTHGYCLERKGHRGYGLWTSGNCTVEMPSTEKDFAWWMHREYLRIAEGTYNMTDVLQMLNNSYVGNQYAVHMSAEDPDSICYTPSVEYGVADRQLRTTLGRFMRKHFMMFSDHQIAGLEAQHRAEVRGEFHMAITTADIQRVYQTMAGDSGCMRHSSAHFGLHNSQHPSHIWAAPNLGVAYTQGVDGTPRSRAVVYVNPDNPADKRYIRVYGDQMLAKLLKRQGYRPAAITGAKLNKIVKIDAYDTQSEADADGSCDFVMPYIDGVEGRQSETEGTHVALINGELVIVSAEMAARYNRVRNNSATSMKGQSGYYKVRALPPAEFVCELTGLTYSRYDTDIIAYYHDGAVKKVAKKSVLDKVLVNAHCITEVDGSYDSTACLVAAGETPVFNYSYTAYIDTDIARKRCGFTKLDAALYPDASGWYRGAVSELADGRKVKMEDAVLCMNFDDTRKIVFKTELAAMRKLSYVNSDNNGSYHKILVHKMNPNLKRSITGVVFHSELGHNFNQLTGTDQWAGARSIREVHMNDLVAIVLKTDTRSDFEILGKAEVAASFTNNYYAGQYVEVVKNHGVENDQSKRVLARNIADLLQDFNSRYTYDASGTASYLSPTDCTMAVVEANIATLTAYVTAGVQSTYGLRLDAAKRSLEACEITKMVIDLVSAKAEAARALELIRREEVAAQQAVRLADQERVANTLAEAMRNERLEREAQQAAAQIATGYPVTTVTTAIYAGTSTGAVTSTAFTTAVVGTTTSTILPTAVTS
jgi:hypothetical protein